MLTAPAAPPMIRTDTSNAFAHNTMRVRVPAIVREVAARNPDYPTLIHDRLEQLAVALETDAPIPLLDPPAPDYASWAAQHSAHGPATWQGAAWLFAEFYAYRLLIQAVRWWETGRDPFAPAKAEEYASGQPWALLERALDSAPRAPEARPSCEASRPPATDPHLRRARPPAPPAERRCDRRHSPAGASGLP